MRILGIDVGGSGIKGAPVDTATGELLAERRRIRTPTPATPQAVTRAVARLVDAFGWKGAIGCGMPAAVRGGTLLTAANLDQRWIGTDAAKLFGRATGAKVTIINDADAAGYAEMTFGAGRGKSGLVIIVTLGTGIGTALFINGHLVPNTELGHLEMGRREAEHWASERIRKDEDLSWKRWAKRVDDYLHLLQRYFWPDLFIIGGGVSKKADKFVPRLSVHERVEVVPAELLNDAGIVGAALAYAHVIARRGTQTALGGRPSARGRTRVRGRAQRKKA